MTIERWEELNDHLLSISVGGEEIGQDNGCHCVDAGAYVREKEFEWAFEDEREQEAWATICNLQTVKGLSLQDATEKVNGLSREELRRMTAELSVDEDACVYHTEGWND